MLDGVSFVCIVVHTNTEEDQLSSPWACTEGLRLLCVSRSYFDCTLSNDLGLSVGVSFEALLGNKLSIFPLNSSP
jgi:hypothetical protein